MTFEHDVIGQVIRVLLPFLIEAANVLAVPVEENLAPQAGQLDTLGNVVPEDEIGTDSVGELDIEDEKLMVLPGTVSAEG